MRRRQRGLATLGVAVLAGLGAAPAAHGGSTSWVWDLAQSLDACNQLCLQHFTLIGPDQPGQHVVETKLNVRFTTIGGYNAADFYLDLDGPIVQPDGSIGQAWTVTGADLGWSGQGTFAATVATDVLNGEVYLPEGAPASFWSLHVGDFGHEYQGSVSVLQYELVLSDGPPLQPGDLDGDGVVGVNDLLSLLAGWGPCPDPPAACPGDLDGDGVVEIEDLLALLANWS
jgi:hypothetical protein